MVSLTPLSLREVPINRGDEAIPRHLYSGDITPDLQQNLIGMVSLTPLSLREVPINRGDEAIPRHLYSGNIIPDL